MSELEFNVPFQHKHGYIRDERPGMISYPWPPFCSAATQKRERDREPHLNYYASAYNRGDNNRITRLKLNRHELNKHAPLTKNTTNISDLQPGNGAGPYSGR